MAMTFLCLEYTRGRDAAIWRLRWSSTDPLIERPGINSKCPFILLFLAPFFPCLFLFFFLSRTTVLDKSWPFDFLVGNLNLVYGALTGTEQFYGQNTSLAARRPCFWSWTVHLFCICSSLHLPRLMSWSFLSTLSKIRIIQKSRDSCLVFVEWLKQGPNAIFEYLEVREK